MHAVLFMISRIYGRIYKHIRPIQFRLSRSKPTTGPIFFDMDLDSHGRRRVRLVKVRTPHGRFRCAAGTQCVYDADWNYIGSSPSETAFEYFTISPVTHYAHATSVSWRRYDAIIDDRYHSDSAVSMARRHTVLGNGRNKIFITISRRSKITCFKTKISLLDVAKYVCPRTISPSIFPRIFFFFGYSI